MHRFARFLIIPRMPEKTAGLKKKPVASQLPWPLSAGFGPDLTGTGMTPIQVTRRPSISRTVT